MSNKFPFDLEAALAGAPVVTRNECQVDQLTVLKLDPYLHTLVGVIHYPGECSYARRKVCTFDTDGIPIDGNADHQLFLTGELQNLRIHDDEPEETPFVESLHDPSNIGKPCIDANDFRNAYKVFEKLEFYKILMGNLSSFTEDDCITIIWDGHHIQVSKCDLVNLIQSTINTLNTKLHNIISVV